MTEKEESLINDSAISTNTAVLAKLRDVIKEYEDRIESLENELKKYKDRELKEIAERCSHKQYKYTFHLAVSGNDEYCMSMSKKETYLALASSDIDAYNIMIDYCNSQDYSSFAVEYIEREVKN